MRQLPTTCPGCHKQGVTYSTGVIPSTIPGLDHAHPIVRCGLCHHDFFLPPPYHTWQRCHVSTLIAFTSNPDAIDSNIKLEVRRRPVEGGGWYLVSPASQG
jgi:hypothetical protein